MIDRNIAAIMERINGAARRNGRNPEEITLVCVTKNRPTDDIRKAINCGVTNIGENRVQEAASKYKDIVPAVPIRWHMIGHLQTNKARDAVKMFSLIHSVDSLRLAAAINKEAANINKIQDILIEVKTSLEAAKFGIQSEELPGLVKDIVNLQNVRLLGLMTMAPIVGDKDRARPYFKKLKQLQGEINNFLLTIDYRPLTALSMGMSQDYEAAVEEGATIVRIGSAIFESG